MKIILQIRINENKRKEEIEEKRTVESMKYLNKTKLKTATAKMIKMYYYTIILKRGIKQK